MAKIRLYKTMGGGRGWSVPYKHNGMTLRHFEVIEGHGKAIDFRAEGVGSALKVALNTAKDKQNRASELGRID